MFFKIVVLKNFAIFSGKHLCWSLRHMCFLVNITKIFKNSFFYEIHLVAASVALITKFSDHSQMENILGWSIQRNCYFLRIITGWPNLVWRNQPFFDLDDFRYLFYDQKNASKIYPSLSNHFRDSFLNLNKYINFVALPAIVKQYCFFLFVLTFLFSLFWGSWLPVNGHRLF